MKCLHYAINERKQGHWENPKGCCVCVGGGKMLFPALLIIDLCI